MPEGDTLFRTAAGLRPYLVGREVLAARTQGPGPVPQVHRIIGKRIDAVDSHGKNLLIRFDGGLELRTHLRMNGSWHRYRPGEEPTFSAPSVYCQDLALLVDHIAERVRRDVAGLLGTRGRPEEAAR